MTIAYIRQNHYREKQRQSVLDAKQKLMLVYDRPCERRKIHEKKEQYEAAVFLEAVSHTLKKCSNP